MVVQMNVQTVDYKDKNARSALATSLRETGFAVLVNHPITPKRINEAYDDWADFFASDSKQDWLFDPEHQDGFFPFNHYFFILVRFPAIVVAGTYPP